MFPSHELNDLIMNFLYAFFIEFVMVLFVNFLPFSSPSHNSISQRCLLILLVRLAIISKLELAQC